MTSRKSYRWIVSVGLVLLLHAATAFSGTRVQDVFDGDTFLLEDGRTVRYLGVNAPEAVSELHSAQPFAEAATAWNRKMVLGKTVRLEMDVEERDEYGRTLAYVYLSDGTFVNQAILAAGLAQYFPYIQNMKHAGSLLDAQRSAMKSGVGLWRNWNEKPALYIGNRRSLRFHAADCPFGRKTSIRNRKEFHRMWDAYWEGYFPCKQCLPERGLTARP
ncbi:MAG: thermonuclease family protein [Thermodesulfobacteriota bacterium]